MIVWFVFARAVDLDVLADTISWTHRGSLVRVSPAITRKHVCAAVIVSLACLQLSTHDPTNFSSVLFERAKRFFSASSAEVFREGFERYTIHYSLTINLGRKLDRPVYADCRRPVVRKRDVHDRDSTPASDFMCSRPTLCARATLCAKPLLPSQGGGKVPKADEGCAPSTHPPSARAAQHPSP